MFKGLSYRPTYLIGFTPNSKMPQIQYLNILASEWAFFMGVLIHDSFSAVVKKIITLILFNFEISYLFEAWGLAWFLYANTLQPLVPTLKEPRFKFKFDHPSTSVRYCTEAEREYPRYKTNPQRCVWLRWKRHLHNLETYSSLSNNNLPKRLTLRPVTFSANKLFY